MIEILATKKSSPPWPPGQGASWNLKTQLPFISDRFPEIKDAHCGTVNFDLECPLLVLCPDHRTNPIKWSKDFSSGEVFDLLRIKLEYREGDSDSWLTVNGWIYVAHGSAHRKNPISHEIILPRIIKIPDGSRCGIIIPGKCIRLYYDQFKAVIVIGSLWKFILSWINREI